MSDDTAGMSEEDAKKIAAAYDYNTALQDQIDATKAAQKQAEESARGIWNAYFDKLDFIITDRATEEVLVRSFVKHDGLMDKWNLAAAMAREFTAIASQPIRGVVAHELGRLKADRPDYRGWTRPDVKKVLRRVAIAPADALRMTLPNPSQSPKERSAE